MISGLTRSIQIDAPAKLNLFLELHGRRNDGYHDLETVMIAIDRFDHLTVSLSESDTVETDCCWRPHDRLIAARYGSPDSSVVSLPNSHDNLVTRALQCFRETFHIDFGFRVELRKTIPAGAGMGGASSDAAAALQGAAHLCGVDPHHPDLLHLAGLLGSDIPFFFGSKNHRASAALGSGRGEQITSIDVGQRIPFVVVHPPVGISTKQVYQTCSIPTRATASEPIIAAMAKGNLTQVSGHLVNRLTEPARAASDWVDRVLSAISRTPVLGYQMTGSGSACFGICRTQKMASTIAHRLQAAGIGIAFAARSICIRSTVLGQT
ncbi:MAG: 4-(cytidine 5'-diphospho)-2-C-methyl-D-erythritol kinase [Pirellulaceae bacterium]